MQNTDQNEIKKFDAVAARWWDKNGDFKALHDINPLRLGFIQKHSHITGKKVLDIGCGGGILAESMAATGANVTAIDMSAEALKVAKLHLYESQLEIDYQHSTAEDFAASHAEQFEVITCLELLEHVPNPESIIAAAANLLKPGGSVFFSTINRNPKSFLQAIVGAEYLLKLLPKGMHEYRKFIRPSELSRWARQQGLKTTTMTGMGYNLLQKTYHLSKNVDVNYIVCMTKETHD